MPKRPWRKSKPSPTIILLGSSGAGKTALMGAWLGRPMPPGSYQPSIVEKESIELSVPNHKDKLNVNLHEVSGVAQFELMRKEAISEASAAVVVFTVKSRWSFDFAEHLLSSLQIPAILVATKIDMPDPRCVDQGEAQALVERFNCEYFEVSTSSDLGIADTIPALVRLLTCERNITYNS